MRSELTRERLLQLVRSIPKSAYAKYPNLNGKAVQEAVEGFVASS